MKFTPKTMKRFINFYPPYIGAGIKVTYISDNWQELHVAMSVRWFNRNAVGTHFGGSLYSMIDPQIMLLLMRILGNEYIVWDKAASIDFIKASKKKVTAVIKLSDEEIQTIREKTAAGEKYLPTFNVDIRDTDDALIATINKTLYIRKKTA
jgi:acyl-coenzyme A thioesterase PaaI-like protein